MPAPIILISNQRIKPGQLEAYKLKYAGAVQRFLAGRPGTLAHAAYMDESGTQVSVVMAFSDPAAMEAHMLGLGSSPQQAQESMEFASIEIYGTPTAITLETIRQMVGANVPVMHRPHVVDGYIRSSAGTK